jgi:hypothetical protein
MHSSTPQSHASMLATINADLDKIAPKFEVQPDQIQILQTPAQFYDTLKVSSLISSPTHKYIHSVPFRFQDRFVVFMFPA